MEFSEFIAQFTTTELVIMGLISLAVLLFGYRIKKIAFFAIWFIVGLTLARIAMPWMEDIAPEVMSNPLWHNLMPIVGGLIAAMLGFSVEKLCVSGITFALIMLITTQYFGTDYTTLIVGAILGIVAGGAAVMLMKPAIIIATSLAGAYASTLGALNWMTGINLEVSYFPILIGITIFGSVFQFLTTKHIS